MSSELEASLMHHLGRCWISQVKHNSTISTAVYAPQVHNI